MTPTARGCPVRASMGHYYHFHIRIVCPPGRYQLRAPAGADQRGWLRRRGGSLDRPAQEAGKPAEAPARQHPPSLASRSISCPGECEAVLTTAGGPAIPSSATRRPAEKATDPQSRRSFGSTPQEDHREEVALSHPGIRIG